MRHIDGCPLVYAKLIPHPQNGHHFHRRHFQMHFHGWKFLYFHSNFTEVCSQGPNWQWVSVGSGNGLTPNRRQAITRANAGPVHWHIYAALGGDKLSVGVFTLPLSHIKLGGFYLLCTPSLFYGEWLQILVSIFDSSLHMAKTTWMPLMFIRELYIHTHTHIYI